MKFCEKLNEYGKAPKGWKFALPTETQWEYAARGGKNNSGYTGGRSLDEVCWYYKNSGLRTMSEAEKYNEHGEIDSNRCRPHMVGGKKANALGLHDMIGNVWEWCLDDYNKDSRFSVPEFTRSSDDKSNAKRVIRGGGWNYGSFPLYLSTRDDWDSNGKSPNIGFRVVLVPAQ